MTPKNVKAGFERAGLHPWNPQKVLSSFALKLDYIDPDYSPKEDMVGDITFSEYILQWRARKEQEGTLNVNDEDNKYDVLKYKPSSCNLVTEEESLAAFDASQKIIAEKKAAEAEIKKKVAQAKKEARKAVSKAKREAKKAAVQGREGGDCKKSKKRKSTVDIVHGKEKKRKQK